VNRAVKLCLSGLPTRGHGSPVRRGLSDCATLQESRVYKGQHALPETTVSLIADLVEADSLPANQNTELHGHLLAAHQLTDIQRVEQLHQLSPLTNQMLSEILAEMLRLCPKGQENNSFFNCLFLNKLPKDLQILLSEAYMVEKQALGDRADLFIAHNSKMAHDVVAAVAAIYLEEQEGEGHHSGGSAHRASSGKRGSGSRQGGGRWKNKKKSQCGGRCGHGVCGRGGGSGQQMSHTVSHAEQARL